MTSAELRSSFLRFFERKGHRVVPSAPLVPHEDPTLLFTNAGMNQFKDVFLGRERRDYNRAASSQKCMRVSGKHNDLDNVGPSLRHHTFFEMLGNFSFGDYFKHDAIGFAWELLTDVWKLPAAQLYATVFKGEGGIPRDDEAFERWTAFLPEDRIAELGLADNFWQMGDTGPCGRCSEIHFFRGSDLPCPEPVCLGPACDCDRFVEVWNNVFMEFDRQPDGSLKGLPAPSIDTGMGLERVAAVTAGTLSNYDTDVFAPLLAAIAGATGRQTDAGAVRRLATEMAGDAVSTRVIADHLRAMTFLIADGVVPSNEWRGYVLRKIMRRAMRHGKRLGVTEPFLHALVDVLVSQMGDAYPELAAGRDEIVRTVRSEEERFDAVLTGGLPRLEELLDRAAAESGGVVSGEEAFRLYDTWGLPLEFIEDLTGERKLTLDRAAFDRALEAQRERARAGSAFDPRRGEAFTFAGDEAEERLRKAGDVFEGYTATGVPKVRVLAVFDEGRRQIDRLEPGRNGYVILDRTPFYVEAGGQVSDVGELRAPAGTRLARVEGVVRTQPGLPRAHRVSGVTETIQPGELVEALVSDEVRDATRRNHTATHLLHAALRQVLGPHVRQKGSLVAPDRLRFDFSHGSALSPDEIEALERLVNAHVRRNSPVVTEERSTEEAIAAGAMALFGEKYGDRVRVVSVPGFSVELCGGTHCAATGDIGLFTIVEESGVAAGVRRIEALTGEAAVERLQRQRAALAAVLDSLRAGEDQAPEAIAKLQAEIKRLTRDVHELRTKLATGGGGGNGAGEAVEINGVQAVIRRLEGLDKAGLRDVSDSLKSKLRSGVIVLASSTPDGKVGIVVSVTPDLKGRLHAGQIVKEIAPIVGGGGGGRPDFAEAGGKDASKLDLMLEQSRAVIHRMTAS